MDIPDSLAYKMELFRERGVVAPYREGMFLDASWLAVYFGQGVIPRHYDPAADRLDRAALRKNLDGIRSEYANVTGAMPRHEAYLRDMGAMAG